MMVRSRIPCLVCDSKISRSFHKFPSNERVRALWFKSLNLKDYDEVKCVKVCSRHFRDDDFINIRAREFGGKMKLLPSAVPSLYLPIPEEEMKLTSMFEDTPPQEELRSMWESDEEIKPTLTLRDIYSQEEFNMRQRNQEEMKPRANMFRVKLSQKALPKRRRSRKDLQQVSTVKKRKLRRIPYIGSLTLEDLSTPEKAMKNLNLAKTVIYKLRKRVNVLNQSVKKLSTKHNALKNLLRTSIQRLQLFIEH